MDPAPVIQSILLFSLGFLCAFFLALLFAPRVARRAARLTRSRIEASVPLTKAEIVAQRDGVRAEYATAVRRLEMALKSEREKAAARGVALSDRQEEIETLTADRDAKAAEVASLDKTLGDSRETLAERERELEGARERLEADRKTLAERAGEIDELGRLYEEASFSSSSRQIELVAREGEIERLNDEISSLRNRHREAERRAKEAVSGQTSAEETLRAERKKVDVLETKLERIMTTLSDREEALERREKDIERLRDTIRRESGGRESGRRDDAGVAALTERLEKAEKARGEYEAELSRMTALLSEATSGDVQSAIDRVSAERDRIEARLTALVRENKRLRKSLSAGEGDAVERENAALRDQISDLAAEVVHLAAKLEGPDSDIARALADAQGEGKSAKPDAARITSLADRVRALQKASAAGSS